MQYGDAFALRSFLAYRRSALLLNRIYAQPRISILRTQFHIRGFDKPVVVYRFYRLRLRWHIFGAEIEYWQSNSKKHELDFFKCGW